MWATKILKEHITKGFTINKNRVQKNYEQFLQTVQEIKKLLPENSEVIKNNDILELVTSFANTWLNLESYDEDTLPIEGFTRFDYKMTSNRTICTRKDNKQFRMNCVKCFPNF